MAKISGDFADDLANGIIVVAFDGGTCDPISNITNTFEIPPDAVLIQTDDLGLVHATFDAAIPDFSSLNSSRDVNLPYFDQLDFSLEYNPTNATVGGLNPGVGFIDVQGNANLCNILPEQQQCFVVIFNYGESADGDNDMGCVCTTPSITTIDLSSFLLP